MAKELYDWVKLLLDNKWLVMLCLTGAGSISTNIAQVFTVQEKETELISTQNQIAEIANYYAKPKIEKKVYKLDCGVCTTLMNEHKIEFH